MECFITDEYQTEQNEPQNNYKACGAHVIVWAWMSAAGVSSLGFIGGTITSIYSKNILRSAKKLDLRENFRFYQDYDPKHKSWIVQTSLIWNRPHVMLSPVQSPNLNIVEN